jgi:hypothetical protein
MGASGPVPTLVQTLKQGHAGVAEGGGLESCLVDVQAVFKVGDAILGGIHKLGLPTIGKNFVECGGDNRVSIGANGDTGAA